METPSDPLQEFKERIRNELVGNILPFWLKYAPDHENGGFYGAITNELVIHNEEPRSAVLCARILWTFAIAHRQLGRPEYLAMAQRAYEYLTRAMWDRTDRGVFWQVDLHGSPVNDRKHSYAQAFAIYALSEYARSNGGPQSLQFAQVIFQLLETHAHDPLNGGYLEGCSRDWGTLLDMRLGENDPNCRKSMNTLLHLIEAFTGLLSVWEDATLRARLRELVEIFLEKVIDPRTNHFMLFFDDRWVSIGEPVVSYGHEIEGSWLLMEAAAALGDAELSSRVTSRAIAIAQTVYTQGLDLDGGLCYEGEGRLPKNRDKHWWVQAEAVVGFMNAYQASGRVHFANASRRAWDYIQERFVDRTHGEWFKVLDPKREPRPEVYKVGPWECPYHQSRACLEMLQRLGG